MREKWIKSLYRFFFVRSFFRFPVSVSGHSNNASSNSWAVLNNARIVLKSSCPVLELFWNSSLEFFSELFSRGWAIISLILLFHFSLFFLNVLKASCWSFGSAQTHSGHQFGERPFGRSSHVIIQLIFNTAKQRYIYSKQTKKSENKDTVIKFLMSRNIRSLRNTTHNNERYVPITGYRRHNYTRTKYINSLGHHNLMTTHFRHSYSIENYSV